MSAIRKRVLLVGATGTIGTAVAAALSPSHEIVRIARRAADIEMDALSVDSVRAMYEAAGPFDAMVSTMGSAVPGPLAQLSAQDFADSFTRKVLAQINLVLLGIPHIAPAGSFTLSSGILSTMPQPGFAAISMANAAIDGFCRAASLELPAGVRINCVRPVFVRKSFPAGSVADLGGFPAQTAAETAAAYRAVVEGDFTGQDLDPRDLVAPGLAEPECALRLHPDSWPARLGENHMDLEAELRRLADEAEIKRVQLRYCRGLDRMDWDLIRTCFHRDGIHDLGPFKGTVEKFIPWVSALMPSFESTTHFGGGQTVEIDGDDAWAEQYVRAYHRTAATDDSPATDWILNLRYVDHLTRRDGEWRIAHRRCACESQRTDVVTGDAALGPEWLRGERDHTDASYRRRP